MATVPALWNQLRFNTNQPPAVANLLSQASGRSPGAILLGPDTQSRFVFADGATLEVAQRLARRDVQKLREQTGPQRPPDRAERRSRSPSPDRPPAAPAPVPGAGATRPVPRLCKAGDQAAARQAAQARLREKRAEKEEARRRQQQQLRKKREDEEEERQRRRQVQEEAEADLRRRRQAREQEERAAKQRQVQTRVSCRRSAAGPMTGPAAPSRPQLPARGDSPPVRDTDPQLSEIRAQHKELMGMLRQLTRMKAAPARQIQARPAPARPRGYLSQTHASKERHQRPARRRPCQQRPGPEDDDDEEEELIQLALPPRALNEAPTSRSSGRTGGLRSARTPTDAARERQEVLRRQLAQRLDRTPPVAEDDGPDTLTDLLLDEVLQDAATEIQQLEAPLPGYCGDAAEAGTPVLEPTMDEIDFRLQQIEADHDAIRQRWRSLNYEEVPPAGEEEKEAAAPVDVSVGPLRLDNRALMFTKRAGVVRERAADNLRLVPRPPTHLTVGLSRAALRSIAGARQRYLDWCADRPGPRFSVELPVVADWLGADLVDEALTAAVLEVDRASDDIVNLLFEGEMAAGDVDDGGSTLADDDGDDDGDDGDGDEGSYASSSASTGQ